MTQTSPREPIAIVGIGCRFPGGVNDPAGLWRALRDGVDAITEIPRDRFDADALFTDGAPAPGRIGTRWGGFLDDIDRFDPAFFGISPREAETLDPQQRLLLETGWEALEDAGQPPSGLRGSRTGVYVGLWLSDWEARLFADPDVEFHMTTGSGRYAASGRLSYTLGLQGPSLTVDTACSSSLVAVHLACRSIWSGECRLALAGGANVILQPQITVAYSQSGMMAADGRCKFGDARANGYVRSEGAAMIVLKPLSRAVADGDRVYATIRGSAVNNDGRTGDYMATPAQAGQEQMLRLAYEDAGLSPGRVRYVEAHGTGTGAGDPVEIGALGAVLATGRAADRPCLVGSVKTNFGHTEGAAGVAGLIKAALVLHHREVPASLHLRQPNPAIPWHMLPLSIATERVALPADGAPLVAGVSSFGIAGTNAHVVLEEAPAAEPAPAGNRTAAPTPVLVPLSAHSPEALRATAARWADALDRPDAPRVADVAHTAGLRRDHHPHRLAVAAASTPELAGRLRAFAAGDADLETASGAIRAEWPGTVFVFPGQGPQWCGMGRELIEAEPVFRAALAECEAAMRPFVDWSLTDQLALDEQDPRSLLGRIDVVQPTLVSLDIALARLWISWGIQPAAVVGHSMGEVAAAHVAGALGLSDAMRVICLRSRLLRRISGQGAMAVVELTPDRAETALAGFEERVSVAASNSPRSTILSGEPAALRSVLDSLERQDVFCRWVNVDVASHSPQVEPLRDDLRAALDGIEPCVPDIAFQSTALGRAIDGVELGPDYWVENLRRPVLFGDAVQHLVRQGHAAFLEVSPHPVLVPALEQTFRHAGTDALALGSTRRIEPERPALLRTLGELFAAGALVAWDAVNGVGRLMSLPTYAWQRERFWYDRPARRAARPDGGPAHPIFGGMARSAAGHQVWEGFLGTDRVPFLADHRVRGASVLPAAAYLEMALAAGAAAGDGPVTVEDVVFDEAITLGGDLQTEREVQAVVEPVSDRASTVAFFSRTPAGSWTRAATGRLVFEPHGTKPARDPAEPAGELVDGSEAYLGLAADRGLDYGPTFRGVERVWKRDGGAVAEIAATDAVRAGSDGFVIHPALLDACLQTTLHTLTGSDPGGTFLPVAIGRLRLHRRPESDAAFRARAVRRPVSDGLLADLVLTDGQGHAILSVDGVRFRHVPAAADAAQLQFVVGWERGPALEPAAGDAGDWLLIGEDGEVADELRRQLGSAGATSSTVRYADAFREVGPSEFEADPRRPDDLEQVLRRASADRPLRGVVLVCSLDRAAAESATADDLDAAQQRGVLPALHLVQALTRHPVSAAPRLWLVTRGAQAAGEHAEPLPGLAHAPVWGMAGVIANEHPEFRCSCVDLDPEAGAAGSAAALAAELLADGAGNRIALRRGERRVARLVSRPDKPQAGSGPPAQRRIAAPYAIVTARPGVLDQLEARPRARRAPGPGEVEIEVRAVGLNFMNVMSALGTYPGYPNGLGPLGIECAGVIAAVGDGVEGFSVGDEVVAFAFNCLGTHAVADARLVAAKPARLSMEEAAAVPIAFLTASYALEHLGRVEAGERVLIHAASGGVGLAAVAVARAAGAEVFATAGSERKRQHLRSLGIEHVFDSRSLDFGDGVRRATGDEGVDIVLNSLPGEAIARGLSILRPFGRFLELGKRDIYGSGRVDLSPFRNQLSYSAIDLDRGARERPALLGRILRDVVARVDAGELAPLPVEVFGISRVADAFHRMARAQHTGKLVVAVEPEVETSAPAGALRPDATYLVTGGLGALGLEVARWMVGEGARNVALLGRSEPTDAARAAIAEMEGFGARVWVERADVSREAEVAQALERIAAELPPLRGVVHAAGLLADGTVQQMDEVRLAEATAPKLRGAWNLHRLTRHLPLDLFVLFSSVSATIGIPGQANYAAGNAFLDALAHHRRAAGLPALSIGWGPWSGVGLAAARTERGARLRSRGLGSLGPAEAIAAMAALVGEPSPPHVTVARLDADRWCASHPAAAAAPLLSRLRSSSSQAPAGESVRVALRDRVIAAAAGSERQALLEAHLRMQAAQVLRLAPERVSMGQPLKSLGMDSLMSLEFRNRIESDLALALSATAVWNYPTISLLARHLVERLAPAGTAPTAEPAAPAAAPHEPGNPSDPEDPRFVSLDRAQVESLLERELAAIDDLLNQGGADG